MSLIPLTAPLAMPGRIALGAAAWWQPPLALGLALATLAILVYAGGRLYVRAILHSGSTLRLRDAWPISLRLKKKPTMAPPSPRANHPLLYTIITCAGVAAAALVAVLFHDVIIGVIVGAALVGAGTQILKLWTGHSTPTPHRR